MTYATILLHIELERVSVKQIHLAAELADRLDAQLIGTVAVAPIQIPVFHGVTGKVPDMHEESKIISERIASVRDIFVDASRRAKRVEWRGNCDFPTESLLLDARAADLIIIGHDQPSPAPAWPLDVGRVILRAGRPVLLTASETESFSIHRILIGWKDAREARRAVRDAIPLLQKAEEVILLEACEQGEEHDALKRLSDVEAYLRHHGVGPCTKIYIHETTKVAEEFARIAQAEGAGLIVAGAYGHSRLGELVFGGVTRDLLAECPVSCLLSH